LVGGVTGAEFWRMALALLNAMFVSLAAGILVSTFHRDSQRAMASALGLMLLLVAAVPVLSYLASQTHLPPWTLAIRGLSPFYAYAYSADALYPRHPGMYWGPLFATHFLGWLFLAVASRALPHLWQEGAAGPLRTAISRFWNRKGYGRTSTRAWLPRELLSKNPIAWLLRTEFRFPWAVWAVVVAWAVTMSGMLLRMPASATPMVLSHYGVAPFGFLFKILFALQACKFFSESRRNGTLELLLSTSLTDREIVQGQVSALWRGFLWPLVTFCCLTFAPGGLQLAMALFTRNFQSIPTAFGSSFLAGIYTVRFLADLLAVCWFGMALALSLKKSQLAPALTVLYVLVLPAILAACFLDLLPDIFFILWGVARTRSNLRQFLVRQYDLSATAV
jgi:ABC-type transport system involved in multi-copper enzyme maturation permease subunit